MNRSVPGHMRADVLMVVLCCGPGASCAGSIHDPGGTAAGGARGVAPGEPVVDETGFLLPERELAATVGIRRLSTNEYDATVLTLLGDTGSHALPLDKRNLFDSSDAQEKQIGETLISQVESLASDIAAAFVNDAARRDRFIGCGPSDRGCLENFVTRFGRLALRHPLSSEDRQAYLDIPRAADTMGDFYKSIELIVTAFLQDPEFLNRFEVGSAVKGAPGLVKLTGWELASRMSYLLWGDMPSPELLDHVEAGGLSTADDVAAWTRKMLADPRALGPVALFHALWLGYQNLSHSLADPMRNETHALLSKVIFEDHRPWQDVFRAEETFVTYELARHYKLAVPAGLTKDSKATWVPYPTAAVPRRGILSHGTLLSLGNKFGDTSPTKRGREILQRMLCQEVHEPKPELLAMFKVDTNRPPAGMGSLCKWDRYEASRQISPSCGGCHDQIDLLGFGLENFDPLGRYRTDQYWTTGTDGLPALADAGTAGAVHCTIKADGEIDGKAFLGPAGLSDQLTGSAEFTGCALSQLYRFGTGVDTLDDGSHAVIDRFAKNLGTADFRLEDVLRKLVSSPAFAHRRMDIGK